MRTLMLCVSALMVGAGTFCIANASVAFASTAFVIGAIMLVVGVVELLVARRTSINEDRGDMTFPVSGMVMILTASAILSGVVSEDVTIGALFAVMLARDGFIDLFSLRHSIADNTREENANLGVGLLCVILGIYMLYNSVLMNLATQILVGAAIILMGMRRFLVALQVKYTHPGFLTGNEERLADARREEKRAMAKAKEGIRESKEAQRRIEKIKQDIAVERRNMNDTTMRARRNKESR